MEYVLKTKDLKKTYGNYNALNGLSMNVPKGSIYGLIGRNGVGENNFNSFNLWITKSNRGRFFAIRNKIITLKRLFVLENE